MQSVLITIRMSVLGVLAVLALVVWWPTYMSATGAASAAGVLQVHFLDVGQGDAIFIETPDGVQVLIDGGPDGTVLRELTQVMPRFDWTIDMVVGTHPDLDHIGGLIDVLARYEVAQILTTNNPGTTVAAERYQAAIMAEDAFVHVVERGQQFQLGASTTLRIFSPTADAVGLESNASSIVAQLVYGDTSFLLTGDATIAIEEYLATRFGSLLESSVLKLGHHGSRTSTSEYFLETVTPAFAVVSAGADNTYGHPHPDVVTRVTIRDIPLLHTADAGRVSFVSDGVTVRLVQ